MLSNEFFPTAETFINLNGFDAYLELCSQALDDRLWSDMHKEVFGFRPREAWHYPHPGKIDEACDIMHRMIANQISMERTLKLANQYKIESLISQIMHRNGFSYHEALCRLMAEQGCAHNGPNGPRGGTFDEGEFCYRNGIHYGLEDTFRHVVRLEL